MLWRYLLLVPREEFRLLSVFAFPSVDIAMWGYVGIWMQEANANVSNVALAFLTSVALWEVFAFACSEMSIGMMTEIWSFNMANIFSTPLLVMEWYTAVFLYAIIVISVVAAYATALIWAIYGISIAQVGFPLVLGFASLILAGTAVGSFTMGILANFGPRLQSLCWLFGWLLAPFSGAYYPLEVLPHWMQIISRALPMAYVMEALRNFITHGTSPYRSIGISFLMGFAYLVAGYIFFRYMFNKSLDKGLARLAD